MPTKHPTQAPPFSRSACGARYMVLTALVASSSFALLYVAGCATNRDPAANQTALDAYVQGVKAYNSGDTQAAMQNLQRAIEKKSDLVMARSMLGDLYRARSEYDSAR